MLPKGTVEEGEEFKDTAIREVKEETGVDAQIIKYVGKSQRFFVGWTKMFIKYNTSIGSVAKVCV